MKRKRPVRDDDLRELLSSAGLRVTEQRMVVLTEMAKLHEPISHPELTERLADTSLDRATIYRNLLSLTEAGLLVKTQLGDNVWRFELPSKDNAGHHRHPHFVCNNCGDVACLPESAVVLRGQAARAHVAEVQLRGRCQACGRA